VKQVSIVIPAYEESENLKILLPKIVEIVDRLSDTKIEILVVLPDFSLSEEISLVQSYGARPIIRTPTNSFGDALRSGISNLDSKSEFTIIMDADGSHNPDRIPELVNYANDFDIVVSSRYTKGGSTDNNLILRTMSRVLNIIYKIILGLDCNDISTNYKIYKTEDLKSISLSCKDFDIVEEIFYKIHLLNNRKTKIFEIPDHFSNRNFGVTKRRLGPFIVSYFVTLIKLRFNVK
jgi:dolichol-phosphate mannosyltransferase